MPRPRPREVSEDDAAEVIRAYAEAVVNAAEKGGEAEAVLGELDEIGTDVLQANPQFATLLASPFVPASEKDRILAETFEGRALPTVLRFLRVLNRHGRLDLVVSIARVGREIWDRRQNRGRSRSARPSRSTRHSTTRSATSWPDSSAQPRC